MAVSSLWVHVTQNFGTRADDLFQIGWVDPAQLKTSKLSTKPISVEMGFGVSFHASEWPHVKLHFGRTVVQYCKDGNNYLRRELSTIPSHFVLFIGGHASWTAANIQVRAGETLINNTDQASKRKRQEESSD